MLEGSKSSPLIISFAEKVISNKDYETSATAKEIAADNRKDLARGLDIKGKTAFASEEFMTVFNDNSDDNAKKILAERLGVAENSIFIESLFTGIGIFGLTNFAAANIITMLNTKDPDLMVAPRNDDNNGKFNLALELENGKQKLVGTFSLGLNFIKYVCEGEKDHIKLNVTIRVKEVAFRPEMTQEISVLCNFSNNRELLTQMRSVEIFKRFSEKKITDLLRDFITDAIQLKNIPEITPPADKKLSHPHKKSISPPKFPKEHKKNTLVTPKETKKKPSADFWEGIKSEVQIPVSLYKTAVLLRYRKDKKAIGKNTLESLKTDFCERLGINEKNLQLNYHTYDGYLLGVPEKLAIAIAKKIETEVSDNLAYAFEQNKKEATIILTSFEKLLTTLPPSYSQHQILTAVRDELKTINWNKPEKADLSKIKSMIDKLRSQRDSIHPVASTSAPIVNLHSGLTSLINALTITLKLNLSQQTSQEGPLKEILVNKEQSLFDTGQLLSAEDCLKFCEQIAPPGAKGELLRRHEKLYPGIGSRMPYPKDYSVFESSLKEFFQQNHPYKRPLAELKQPADIFSGNFIIGGSSYEMSPKRFIRENASSLEKEYKMGLCFWEHLFFDEHQASLNLFHKTGIMPKDLEERLRYMDHIFGLGHSGTSKAAWNENNYTQTAKALQKAGILIIAIDISYIYKLQRKHTAERINREIDRIQQMNYTAYHIMQRVLSSYKGMWFAFMEELHATYYHNIPGIAELMGARVLCILDNDRTKMELECQTRNEFFEHPQHTLHDNNTQKVIHRPDVTITRPWSIPLKNAIPSEPRVSDFKVSTVEEDKKPSLVLFKSSSLTLTPVPDESKSKVSVNKEPIQSLFNTQPSFFNSSLSANSLTQKEPQILQGEENERAAEANQNKESICIVS